MKKINIGIVGCGNIGSNISKYIKANMLSFIKKIIVFDENIKKSIKLRENISNVNVVKNLEMLVNVSDFIIEAASPTIVPELLKRVIEKNKILMILSIGGLLEQEDLLLLARKKNIRIFLPSGAIAAIDGIKASKIAGIKKITLNTYKPIKAIQGEKYILDKKINLDEVKEELVVFKGKAMDAIKAFPRNINVSSLLSIVGIGFKNTIVKIIVSPKYTKNTHKIEIISNAGKINVCVENVPSPENPKTSYLAYLSAVSCLESFFNSVKIGT